jgi:hypothetical protein
MTRLPGTATLVALIALAASGCDGDSSGPRGPGRSFRMGFAEFPPRPDPALVLPTLEVWTQRADAGLVQRLYREYVAAVDSIIGPDDLGIAADRADFPFMDVVGLSSYPYLGGFEDPDSIPINYYSRLVEGASLPVVVLEGGWSSRTVGGTTSSPSEQARYLERQSELLNQAHAAIVFQITFTAIMPDRREPSLRRGVPAGTSR